MKPLEELGKFKTVVIDPPWPFNQPVVKLPCSAQLLGVLR